MSIFAKDSGRRTCNGPDDIPKEQHFAIITFGTIHIPGDERSRTNPGHGYPAYDAPNLTYTAYWDQVLWEDVITTMTKNKEKFVAMDVRPAIVKTEVKVTIST